MFLWHTVRDLSYSRFRKPSESSHISSCLAVQPKDEHAKIYGSPAANVDSPRKEAVALKAMSAADIGTHAMKSPRLYSLSASAETWHIMKCKDGRY